jgi:hypothetical protein
VAAERGAQAPAREPEATAPASREPVAAPPATREPVAAPPVDREPVAVAPVDREPVAAAPAPRELAAVVVARAALAALPERRARGARRAPGPPARAAVAPAALGVGPAAAPVRPATRETPAPAGRFAFPTAAVRSAPWAVARHLRQSASTTRAMRASATPARSRSAFRLAETATRGIPSTSTARCLADEPSARSTRPLVRTWSSSQATHNERRKHPPRNTRLRPGHFARRCQMAGTNRSACATVRLATSGAEASNAQTRREQRHKAPGMANHPDQIATGASHPSGASSDF